MQESNIVGDYPPKSHLQNLFAPTLEDSYEIPPKVSVIIPVYNVAEYLPACLDSVINQNLKSLEVICVDDKSTDNSLEILNLYASKDNRIKIIKHSENRGLGDARNNGLKAASGKYIHFLDSDDWIEKDIYTKVIPVIEDEQLDFINFTLKIYREFSKSPEDVLTWGDIVCGKVLNPAENTFVFRCMEMTCLRIFNKEFLDKNKLSFKNMRNEDTPFYVECLLKAERIMFVNEPLYNYRKRKNSLMDTRFEHYESYFEWYVTMKSVSKKCRIKSLGDEISSNALSVLFDTYYEFLKAKPLKALAFAPKLNKFIRKNSHYATENFYFYVTKNYIKKYFPKLFICCLKLNAVCGKILLLQ